MKPIVLWVVRYDQPHLHGLRGFPSWRIANYREGGWRPSEFTTPYPDRIAAQKAAESMHGGPLTWTKNGMTNYTGKPKQED